VELNQSLYALDSTTIDGRLDERFTAPSTRKVSKIDIGFVAFSAMKKNSAQTDRPTTGAPRAHERGKENDQIRKLIQTTDVYAVTIRRAWNKTL
jgi:hypothetical protein